MELHLSQTNFCRGNRLRYHLSVRTWSNPYQDTRTQPVWSAPLKMASFFHKCAYLVSCSRNGTFTFFLNQPQEEDWDTQLTDYTCSSRMVSWWFSSILVSGVRWASVAPSSFNILLQWSFEKQNHKLCYSPEKKKLSKIISMETGSSCPPVHSRSRSSCLVSWSPLWCNWETSFKKSYEKASQSNYWLYLYHALLMELQDLIFVLKLSYFEYFLLR